MLEKRFKTRVGNGESVILLRIPFDLKRAFGRVRLVVWVTVNAYRYRATVAVYKGGAFLPMLREHREAAKVKAGDRVVVAMALCPSAIDAGTKVRRRAATSPPRTIPSRVQRRGLLGC